jgi:hypothetical protein
MHLFNRLRSVFFKEQNLIDGWITVKVLRTSKGATEWETICENKHNVLTLGGRDEFIKQCYTYTSATNRGSNYMAVTTGTTAPSTSDTVLETEITTNGLGRVQCATISHSNGTNTATLGHTFTAAGTFTAVQKAALFNASSSGVMSHEATFGATDLSSTDSLQLTWTLTLG